MEELLQNPAITSTVLPFLLSFVLSIGFGAMGRSLGSRLSICAVGIGFILIYVLILGVPSFLPRTSIQKVYYLSLAGLLVGLAIDLTHTERVAGHAVSYLFELLVLLWLGWRLLTTQPSALDLVTMVGLYLASILVFWRVAATARSVDVEADSRHAMSPTILVMIASIGAGLIALYGASASLAQLAIALGALCGAHLLWHYIQYLRHKPALNFGATGAFGAAGGLLILISVMALFATHVNRWALLILCFVFVADFVARRVALSGRLAHVLNPLLYGIIVALPAAVAVLTAASTADSGNGY